MEVDNDEHHSMYISYRYFIRFVNTSIISSQQVCINWFTNLVQYDLVN